VLLHLNWNRRDWCFFRVGIARLILRSCPDAIGYSSAVLAVLVLLFTAVQAHAGEIEPRAYMNTPVGINFLLAGYIYSDGGLSTAGSSPIKDAQLKMHTGVLAYARSLDVWGKSGKFDVIVPYSDLSGNAMVAGQPRERNVSGFNDPLFRFSVNFYGAPALSVQEFEYYQQDIIIGWRKGVKSLSLTIQVKTTVSGALSNLAPMSMFKPDPMESTYIRRRSWN